MHTRLTDWRLLRHVSSSLYELLRVTYRWTTVMSSPHQIPPPVCISVRRPASLSLSLSEWQFCLSVCSRIVREPSLFRVLHADSSISSVNCVFQLVSMRVTLLLLSPPACARSTNLGVNANQKVRWGKFCGRDAWRADVLLILSSNFPNSQVVEVLRAWFDFKTSCKCILKYLRFS